jgi:hypothetical protein
VLFDNPEILIIWHLKVVWSQEVLIFTRKEASV